MCLSAIYWSRIDAYFFAATKQEAAEAGFDDNFFYEELKKEAHERHVMSLHVPNIQANNLFSEWNGMSRKTPY